MNDVHEAYELVKDRPISELMTFLENRYDQIKKNDLEWFKATRTVAEVGLALYDFAEHIKETEDAES
jgi:hypothetical protein